MRSKFSSKKTDYDGSQLRSHFIFEKFGIAGDAIVSFTGACDVKEHMVDLEDISKSEFIKSADMLHFLIEHFDNDLERTILRKRLLIAIIQEEICKAAGKPVLIRKGNGLYSGNRKLTVSVATASSVSTLIHAGLNITSEKAPVPVSTLSEFNIVPKKLAGIVMSRYCYEMDSVSSSRAKVRPVR